MFPHGTVSRSPQGRLIGLPATAARSGRSGVVPAPDRSWRRPTRTAGRSGGESAAAPLPVAPAIRLNSLTSSPRKVLQLGLAGLARAGRSRPVAEPPKGGERRGRPRARVRRSRLHRSRDQAASARPAGSMRPAAGSHRLRPRGRLGCRPRKPSGRLRRPGGAPSPNRRRSRANRDRRLTIALHGGRPRRTDRSVAQRHRQAARAPLAPRARVEPRRQPGCRGRQHEVRRGDAPSRSRPRARALARIEPLRAAPRPR